MLKKIFIWLGLIAVVALMVVVMVLADRKDKVDGDITTLSVPVTDADWSIGSSTSQVTLLEYGDFQCPACGAYHPALKQLLAERGDSVRFVFRQFPLITIHPNAMPSALASEAAGKQGKFWEMHDMLYEKQSEWSNESSAEQRFVEYAGKLGLDTSKFINDYRSDVLEKKVNDQYNSGRHSGVLGTPTFYLNGDKIESPNNYDELKKLIDDKIASYKPTI